MKGSGMNDDKNWRSYLYRSLHEARLQDARAAIGAGLQINGLAVTAMLALISAVSPKIGEGHASHIPRAFVWGLGGFALGVFSAALAAVCAYIANHGYAEAESPFAGTDEDRRRARRKAVAAHYVGYGAAALMLIGFAAGVGFAMAGLVRLR